MTAPMVATVCVTGFGLATALGRDPAEVWPRLLRGDTGIRAVSSDLRLRNELCAALPDDTPDGPPGKRQIEVAVRTAEAALRDAGRAADEIDLLVLGTSLGPHLDDPEWPSLHDWAETVADRLGIGAPPVSLTTACSSGSDAILLAATLIRAGLADRCLCGGVDLLTDGKRLGHSALGTMSPTMSRPFDRDHDGMVLGEGAGFLVLENHESTSDEGRVWGRVRGWGSSNDAAGLTRPDDSGDTAALAVRRALARAGVGADAVAVINAHGTGTPSNDTAEAACLGTVFRGSDRLPAVFATKGAFGHTLGATGAIEAITLLLTLHHRVVPPVGRLREVMADFPLPLVTGDPVPVDGTVGISLTLGFGGFNTCLVLDRGAREVADA